MTCFRGLVSPLKMVTNCVCSLTYIFLEKESIVFIRFL